jgi:VanZ family protein
MTSEEDPEGSTGRNFQHHRRRLPFYALIGALLSLFFVPGWGSHGGRLTSYMHDLAHFPLFATIAAGLLALWSKHRHATITCAWVAATALAMALLIEYFQPLVGRTTALGDVLLGVAGAFAAVTIYLAVQSSTIRKKRIFLGLALLAAVACLVPQQILSADWYISKRAFPMLDSFERPVELGRWTSEGCTLEQSRAHVTHGRYALKMTVSDSMSAYPSIFLADGPMDWRGYGRLAVDVYLDGDQGRTVCIRADDTVNPPYEDRAQMAVDLKPGMNTIWVNLQTFARMPGGRYLDLGRVQTVGLFLDHPRIGDTLYIDRVMLSAKSAL